MEQGEDGVLRKIPASVRLEILSVRNVGTLLQLYAFMLVLALINFSLIVALYVAVESLTSGSALQFLNLAKAYALVNVSLNESVLGLLLGLSRDVRRFLLIWIACLYTTILLVHAVVNIYIEREKEKERDLSS